WGVVFPPDSFAGLEFGDTPIHPAQLYFALAGLALFLFAWLTRKRFVVPGHLFWTFLALFALIRIPLDMTRAYESDATVLALRGLPVTESQLTSAAIVLFSLLMMLRLGRSQRA